MIATHTALVAIPGIKPGEKYLGGVIRPDGTLEHSILLPGGIAKANWHDAQAWARDHGGCVLNRIELMLAVALLREEFPLPGYWSDKPSANDEDWIWYHDSASGDQGIYLKHWKLASRAVRRLPSH